MNDLPKSSVPSQPSTTPVSMTGTFGKEQEVGVFRPSESSLQDITKEMDLPKEVAAAGVKTQPTTVSLPPPVVKLGVKPSGTFTPTQKQAAALPLSDVQIAEGLHVNISNSIRWLAEWCRYKLKKLGLIQ